MIHTERFITRIREVSLYIVFGALTTGVNFLVYFLLAYVLNIYYLISNLTAWFISVMFAYITNRKYVFFSSVKGFFGIRKEALVFIFFRGLSGIIDMLDMYLLVDIIRMNDSWAKILTVIIIIILNYIFSKVLIFRKKAEV